MRRRRSSSRCSVSGWRISPSFVDNRRHPCRGGGADASPEAVPGAASFAVAEAPVDGAGPTGALSGGAPLSGVIIIPGGGDTGGAGSPGEGWLPGAFPYAERSSGGFGASSVDSSFTASSIPLRTSSDAFLNSAIPLPRLLARSGSRFGPKNMRTTTRMMSISWKPIPNIRTSFRVCYLLLYLASSRNSKDAREMSDRISGYPIGQDGGLDAAAGGFVTLRFVSDRRPGTRIVYI